jgi:hypothetical protein
VDGQPGRPRLDEDITQETPPNERMGLLLRLVALLALSRKRLLRLVDQMFDHLPAKAATQAPAYGAGLAGSKLPVVALLQRHCNGRGDLELLLINLHLKVREIRRIPTNLLGYLELQLIQCALGTGNKGIIRTFGHARNSPLPN